MIGWSLADDGGDVVRRCCQEGNQKRTETSMTLGVRPKRHQPLRIDSNTEKSKWIFIVGMLQNIFGRQKLKLIVAHAWAPSACRR